MACADACCPTPIQTLGGPQLTRRKLGQEEDSGKKKKKKVDDEGEEVDEDEGGEERTKKKKGIAWGPLLMLIFMFGSSIGGGILVAMEYFGVGGSSKVDNTDTGYYWYVFSVLI